MLIVETPSQTTHLLYLVVGGILKLVTMTAGSFKGFDTLFKYMELINFDVKVEAFDDRPIQMVGMSAAPSASHKQEFQS